MSKRKSERGKPKAHITGYIRQTKSPKVLSLSFKQAIVGTFPRFHVVFVEQLKDVLDGKREFATIYLSRFTPEADKALIEEEAERLIQAETETEAEAEEDPGLPGRS